MNGAGASSAVPALIAALGDESEWVRRNAAEALGMIGELRNMTMPALVRLLQESVERESGAGASAGNSNMYVANQDVYHEQNRLYGGAFLAPYRQARRSRTRRLRTCGPDWRARTAIRAPMRSKP